MNDDELTNQTNRTTARRPVAVGGGASEHQRADAVPPLEQTDDACGAGTLPQRDHETFGGDEE